MDNKNDQFDRSVVEHYAHIDWQSSPSAGVDRKPLDRVGDEVARATSLVRYQANSHFPTHIHHGGEEFLVLEGTFADEHGEYPAGSYVRNPPTTHHAPKVDGGCLIFVKLWQFDPADRHSLQVHFSLDAGNIRAHRHQRLFRDSRETVGVEYWPAQHCADIGDPGGVEILILEGQLELDNSTQLNKYDWIRLAENDRVRLCNQNSGAILWFKRGHLAFVQDDLQQLAR